MRVSTAEQRARKAKEAAHRERWWRISHAERDRGLREHHAGIREPIPPGTRVLLHYPEREGVVITFEESDKTMGRVPGSYSIVRWSNGYESAVMHESLVDLDMEGGAVDGREGGVSL